MSRNVGKRTSVHVRQANSDQPVHSRNLISIFKAHILDHHENTPIKF